MSNGRPTKLTGKKQKQLCDILAQGNTVTCAVAAVNLSTGTFYNWLRRGEKAADIIESGEKIEPGEERYLAFLHAIKSAEIEAEQRCIITIMAASREHWQAAAWWLERRRPESYARRDRLNVSAVSITGSMSDIPPEQEERIKKELDWLFRTDSDNGQIETDDAADD